MVNAAETFGIDPTMGHPERALAFGYAPKAGRDGMVALFALDATLAKLARHTREPVAAQLRLAWWRDALVTLETGAIAGQPLLATLHDEVLSAGVSGAALVRIVDGWESLIVADLAEYARERGGGLFEAAARVLRAADPWLSEAGEGWALADLALTSPDGVIGREARMLAEPRLALARPNTSRAGRPLAALALSVRYDLAGMPEGSPRRIARLLKLWLTGR